MPSFLSEEEKVRIRHHTGYTSTDPVSSIQLGIPRASQPQFLLEGQLNNIPEAACGQIRRYVAILDQIEDLLVDALSRFSATRLGEISINDNETDKLEKEYARWAKRLADDLGIPLNPFAERLRGGMGGVPISVPVQN